MRPRHIRISPPHKRKPHYVIGNCRRVTDEHWSLWNLCFSWDDSLLFIHSFIQSFQSYDRSIASYRYKTSRELSSVSSFNLQCPLFSLTSSSSCLLLLPRLPVTYIFPSITLFRRQLLRQMWPIQLTCLPCTVFRVPLSSLIVRCTAFLHHRSDLSSLSFSTITFRNFPGISDLISEAFKLQHLTQLCTVIQPNKLV